MASLFQGILRRVDFLARYGGEEFVVVLPHVSKAESLEVAEKLRATVEAASFLRENKSAPPRITISVGLANLPADALEQDKLLDYADAALYASKRAGRNRVTAYSAGMELHPGRERGPHASSLRTPPPASVRTPAPAEPAPTQALPHLLDPKQRTTLSGKTPSSL